MAEYPDLYARAYDRVLSEQDEYLAGVKPGKNRREELSEAEVAERYQTLVAGREDRLLKLAYKSLQREGNEPTAQEIAERALEFGKRMERRKA